MLCVSAMSKDDFVVMFSRKLNMTVTSKVHCVTLFMVLFVCLVCLSLSGLLSALPEMINQTKTHMTSCNKWSWCFYGTHWNVGQGRHFGRCLRLSGIEVVWIHKHHSQDQLSSKGPLCGISNNNRHVGQWQQHRIWCFFALISTHAKFRVIVSKDYNELLFDCIDLTSFKH